MEMKYFDLPGIGKLSEEEIAESFVFPVELSEMEYHEASLSLQRVLAERRASVDEEGKLLFSLMQLRFHIEDFLKIVPQKIQLDENR